MFRLPPYLLIFFLLVPFFFFFFFLCLLENNNNNNNNKSLYNFASLKVNALLTKMKGLQVLFIQHSTLQSTNTNTFAVFASH